DGGVAGVAAGSEILGVITMFQNTVNRPGVTSEPQ
ncbi:MAG: hypothetical protein QOE61_2714, partial [Micromonosporaceae bacterium]|nr:hypothetical protein [Micromonosporaceae bacterium]